MLECRIMRFIKGMPHGIQLEGSVSSIELHCTVIIYTENETFQSAILAVIHLNATIVHVVRNAGPSAIGDYTQIDFLDLS